VRTDRACTRAPREALAAAFEGLDALRNLRKTGPERQAPAGRDAFAGPRDRHGRGALADTTPIRSSRFRETKSTASGHSTEDDVGAMGRESMQSARHAKEGPREAPSVRDSPTLPPPSPLSVIRFRSGLPVDELVYRLGVGDSSGALDAAEELFEDGAVARVVLPPEVIATMMLEYRESMLLAYVNGSSTLKQVINDTGLELIDALRALCELVDRRIVVLHEAGSERSPVGR
jgi:hypothetical protein